MKLDRTDKVIGFGLVFAVAFVWALRFGLGFSDPVRGLGVPLAIAAGVAWLVLRFGPR